MKISLSAALAVTLILTLTACGSTTGGDWISEDMVVGTQVVTIPKDGQETAAKSENTTAADGETDKSGQHGEKTEQIGGGTTVKGSTTADSWATTAGQIRTRKTITQKTTKPVETTVDHTVYNKMNATVGKLVSDQKLLAHGRAAVVGDQFQMDWVNTGFEIKGKLCGTISVTAVNDREDTILNVVVDDNQPLEVHVAKGTREVTLVSNLPKGQHTVKVINGTSIRLGTMAIKSVSWEGELQKVSRTRLRIEVLGDSISCGWGMDGVNGRGYDYYNSSAKLAAISNSYYSYAAVAARKLNADLSAVALCAQTIPDVHSFFPTLNPRNGAPAWDFKNNQVDVVVINLGTNDEFQGIGEAKTLANAKALLADVRKAYPKAHIVWVYGMIRKSYAAQYKQAINSMKDDNTSYLDLSAYQNGDGFEAHPSRAANETAGIALANYIKRNCI